jgi:Carboxypeptidase regulatory-like domain
MLSVFRSSSAERVCVSLPQLCFSFLIFFLVAALAPAPSFSQAINTGTVSGVVTDSSGAVVADATITLTDKSTGTPRSANTNDSGHYIFANVPPGDYDVNVSKTGFRNTKSAVTVTVGAALTVDLKLQLGAVSETVEVTATGAELQTMNATVGNTVSGAALDALPSIGGEVSTFVALQPGVAPDGSVAGAVVDQSTFMLDGGNNTNDMDGSMQVYTPSFGGDPTGGIAAGGGLRGGASSGGVPTGVMPTPSDSVEEFKVNTANQTADFNSSAGAQVQVVTKRGTNSWHGTVYDYYLNNNWNANTWDNNASGVANPSYHYNRFGGAIGGPIIPKEILGGKTYFFANYQGFRWNNVVTIERAVPTANMRAGILTFGGVQYNLATGTNCGPSGSSPCDPRGIGINPLIQQMWNTMMPLPNDPSCAGTGVTGPLKGSRCDGVNEQGFKANMRVPQDDDFGVARIDHDFGSKWHFNGAYRYYKLTRATPNQIDIGGVLPHDTFGFPAAVTNRPQKPWYLVAGLTTNITPNLTNDFHYSYLRNFWEWTSLEGPPQFPQLGGALEPLGESHFAALTPYNLDTQNIRTRFWDGKDHFFRDDLTLLHGNHVFQFGGAYQRNWDYHQRTDNGGGINYTTTYQLGDSLGAGIMDLTSTIPAGVSAIRWTRDYAAVTGIVTDAQIAYTRTGLNLALNPPHTPAFDRSTIPYYNVYFSDSWRVKPTLTFTYGLGWTLEMPPTEQQGKQVMLVDVSNQPLDLMAYLASRKRAALQGQVYNPQVGFALIGNTANAPKYPYNPFYGEFSPRIAVAWSPSFGGGFLGGFLGQNKTVIRGGYSRIYGRLNGVDLVLVPLLGTGLIQPVQCTRALSTGACGPAKPTAATAFRIGVDGNVAPLPPASPTLPQPDFPGINDVSSAAGEALDPHFRPNVVDSFDLTIQRQLSNRIVLEVGYIGRRITHEYQPVNINAVPYMMTLGGQSFAQAYAAVETAMGCTQSAGACNAVGVPPAVSPQPFFEAALAGTGYCTGFTSCTAAVVTNEFSNFQTQSVWSLWSDLDQGGIGGGLNGTTVPGFNFPRSMLNSPLVGGPMVCGTPPGTDTCGANGQLSSGVGVNASIGHGNYNGGFVSLRMNAWHGLTLQQNLTYSKALGTGAFVQATSEYTPNDPFNLDNMYGYQSFDRTWIYNVFLVYESPLFRSQKGFLGRVLGGWNFSPIFTAGSGLPLYCNTQTDAQAYGAGDGVNFFDNEQCTNVGRYRGGNSVHNHVAGGNDPFGNSVAPQDCSSGPCFNIFSDPVASYGLFRPPILGVDVRRDGAGLGPIRGLPYWNLDLSIKKNIRIAERFSTEFQFLFLNVLNHMQFANPTLDLSDTTSWGVLSSQGNTPRQMEFGVRLRF